MPRDEDLDLLKAIRLCAYGSVRDRDADYVLRHIFRVYSEFAHTPLHEVEALPLENVLTHYFEHEYENMPEAQRDEEEARLRETRSERLTREREEREKGVAAAGADEEFFKQASARAAAAEKLRQAAVAATGRGQLPEPARDKPIQVGPRVGAPPVKLAPKAAPKVPEDVTIEFVDEAEIGDLDDWNVMGPPPKRK